MSWGTKLIDSLANTYQYANFKFRTPDVAPRYIGTEVSGTHGLSDTNLFARMDLPLQQRVAMTTSWVYSNIIRIGNEVTSADFHVRRKGTFHKDLDHPFEDIMQYPNPFFDGTTLLKYTIWSLSLDPNGAYWFLAPNKKNPGELAEIWPIPAGRMTPVKHKTKYISHYVYTSSNGTTTPIRTENVVRFMYPHPFDLWRSLTPLEASQLVMDVYEGITTAQRDLYSQSRGMPLSILSLDTNISDPDFSSAREVIRDDWEEQRRVAIVRAGTLDIESVGFSNTDLQVIESQQFTRDEIDAIYMGGISWRKDTATGDREEVNKEIKEVVIHPLHKMIAAQIQLYIINPWYGSDLVGEFDDVRAQDRSLSLQENTIYFRSMTVDETRSKLGLEPIKTELDDYGKLPYGLANNPAFISTYYELGPTPVRDSGEKPPEIGNVEDSQDQEALVENLSETDTPTPAEDKTKTFELPDGLQKAAEEGIKEELKRYKKVMLRSWRAKANPVDLMTKVFDSDILPYETREEIQHKMAFVESEEDIKEVFSAWIS